ncbi:MAG: TIGR01212 family radical SAM protein [Muribaculaceae bacterium]|nr:TIGR01212 family radical SAM protein [Muribaculaceae bacterium]
MKTYSDYLSQFFPALKIQKLSVDAGFSCPNRDGTLGYGGCIYCRNDSFTPSYCDSKDPVALQLIKGKEFFARKYPEMKFLAYFQSYTGTYNKSSDELIRIYREALDVEDIVGLVIGTRPDTISDELLKYLSEINSKTPVFIELGAETSHDKTLRLINRNHTWKDVEEATKKIAEAGLHCGLHLIVGLPGEDEEMVLQTIHKVVKLPIETLKIHQLQVLKGTPLLKKIEAGEINIPQFSVNQYIELCLRILKILPDNIVVERFLSQAPPSLVVSPSWGLKNYEFINLLKKHI